jgi:hypothetical protein
VNLPTKWLPAAFANDMVLALRRDENPKTQTRRVMGWRDIVAARGSDPKRDFTMACEVRNDWRVFLGKYNVCIGVAQPRWPVGVGLYVAEGTHQEYTTSDRATPNGCLTVYSCDDAVAKRANGWAVEWTARNTGLPGRFMRRELARTLLTVTAVRAERVNEISEEDAIAEGILCTVTDDGEGYFYEAPSPRTDSGFVQTDTAREAYNHLWDSLHGTKPGERFEDGPFVWCYTLKRITTDYAEAQRILKETAA